MNVTRSTVPGVGERFELEDEHRKLVVVSHHDGRREVFRRDGNETERLATLDAEHARTLGAILTGAFVQPETETAADAPVGDAVVEWVTVTPDSALVGRDAADLSTAATVVAVQRGERTLTADAAGEIEAGDTLVAIGSRDDHERLAARS